MITHDERKTDMIKISLQHFAHKKGMGSTKNGRDSTQVTTEGGVLTIHYSLLQAARESLNASAKIASRLAFTLTNLKSIKAGIFPAFFVY